MRLWRQGKALQKRSYATSIARAARLVGAAAVISPPVPARRARRRARRDKEGSLRLGSTLFGYTVEDDDGKLVITVTGALASSLLQRFSADAVGQNPRLMSSLLAFAGAWLARCAVAAAAAAAPVTAGGGGAAARCRAARHQRDFWPGF
ncbi:MAG: hypothetical protein MZV49_21790 [Rhodopseudomonas palustris]|nr:hypothetical protein [Rhodopseudomonas palustris]